MHPVKHFLPLVIAFCMHGTLWAKDEPIDWEQQRSKHWAWSELTDPNPPQVKDAKWVRNEIDRFILAKLEAKGLSPNGEAAASALNRRLHYDLVGLPGLVDGEGKSFEQVVDILLASEHFGERWARHWLDVARFAESHGFEQDYDRPHAYHFRDFVIKAFNQDIVHPAALAVHAYFYTMVL